MSSRLDISQLKFDQNDIGNLIKSTKTIYSWEFVLDGNRQKIEPLRIQKVTEHQPNVFPKVKCLVLT